ncbi:hypothetical protein TBR22_A31320 [Luteitalea sp. TBR-22]|uniref:RDD family protein n=1 Tax=Luteitalea sp. TBR-22 TaxID=2802971 RepID=UPI001AF0F63E|nr:RDD family protein [Luteitalea sp. TBR-22]BCS33904.1 hypothetical protein TBR22_A31320 [Luteitalea sp. TBR-22]
MRCPKCSYLSYDDVERCRNCGYDFSLATAPREADPVTPEGPPRATRAWEPSRRRRPLALDPSAAADGALDLPLFEEPTMPEPPPVGIPPAGPPLAVRRKLEPPRTPPRVETPPLDDDDADVAAPPAFAWPDEPTIDAGPVVADEAPAPRIAPVVQGDGLGPRMRAGAIDAAILVAIDVLVVWLTLRVAGVGVDEWRLIPLVPLVGFLFLLDVAYQVTFVAASGQTIGKMLTHLRVTYHDDARVPFGHAVVRGVALVLCAAPVGLGLLPLFLDPERRGAHDRLAGTRVGPAA